MSPFAGGAGILCWLHYSPLVSRATEQLPNIDSVRGATECQVTLTLNLTVRLVKRS